MSSFNMRNYRPGSDKNIGATKISESESGKLLGIVIDSKLNFSHHVNHLCTSASQKLYATARFLNFMEGVTLKLIMRSLLMSHLSYCPSIWMCHDRAAIIALRIYAETLESSFSELLALDNSVSFRQGNLQLLMIEVYKTTKKLSPLFMEGIFVEKPNTFNLKNNNGLMVPRADMTSHGVETTRYIGNRLWQSLPSDINESRNLQVFKKYMKNWKRDKNATADFAKIVL